MNKKNIIITVMIVFVFSLAVFAVLTGSDFSIPFGMFDSWGGPKNVEGGDYSLSGSLGDPFVQEKMTGVDYGLTGGFYSNVSPGRAAASDLLQAHAYPVPFKPFEGHQTIKFTQLVNNAVIRIYTVSGELVKEIVKPSDGIDEIEWNVTNNSNEKVVSGVYIYVITSQDPGIIPKKGKLVIIR